MPNGSMPLWDNDGLDLSNELVEKHLQKASLTDKMFPAMPANELIKVKALSNHRSAVSKSNASKQEEA